MPVRAGAQGGPDESEEARQAWQTFVLKEVQRSLAFYNTETRRRGIDKIQKIEDAAPRRAPVNFGRRPGRPPAD